LLRLAAENATTSEDAVGDYSYGLQYAVTCSDYPLPYDLTAPRNVRNAQYAAALADVRQNRPTLFAPFSVDAGIDSQVYIAPLDSCLPWRAPPRTLSPGAPGAPLPPNVKFPTVPTLVLSGDLDSITSVQDAAETTSQFPNAVHVIVPNLGHVVADGDFIGCTLGIVQRFIKTLTPGNTNCVHKIRPVRTVPRFARSTDQLEPVTAMSGNKER
jgi:pimeloyl-ACP methyl ester carboxylesterase